MRIGSANVKRSAGIGAVLAAGFISGFSTETTSLFDEFWSGMLMMGALVFLLTIVLAAIISRDVPLLTGAVLGLVTGCLIGILVGIALVLGASTPFALKLGGRDLADVGGDLAWGPALAWALIIVGAGGAVVGALCGIAAWALHFGLGEKRLGREGDKREAGR